MVRLIRLKIGKSALLRSLTGDQKTLAQEWAKWSEGGEKFPGLLDTEATPIGEAPTWATIRSITPMAGSWYHQQARSSVGAVSWRTSMWPLYVAWAAHSIVVRLQEQVFQEIRIESSQSLKVLTWKLSQSHFHYILVVKQSQSSTTF